MNEHDDLARRLRALGRHSVDPAVASNHLSDVTSRLAGAGRSHRLRTAGVFLAGLLLGGTGLASAGALPAPAQEIAHDTLGAVGVNVPGGERYQGEECRGAKNHGQYVKSQPKSERAAAAKSRCGKPIGAGKDKPDTPRKSGCGGPPPWAAQGKSQDEAAKKAAQEQRRAACGDDDEPAGPAGADKNAGEDGKGTAPAIAAETTTTTTAEPSTTTTTEPVEESTTTTTAAPSTTTTTTILPVTPPTAVTPSGS